MPAIKFYWKLLVDSVKKFLDDGVFTYAAALSYYTIFSLPPIILIVLTVTTWFYSAEEVTAAIFNEIGDMIGEDSAQQLSATVQRIGLFDKTWWASIAGVGFLIFTSTTVFVTIQGALNKIFRVKPKPKSGILKLIRDRIVSFALVLGFAFILLVSLVIDALLSALNNYASRFFPDISIALTTTISLLLPFVVTALLFALIFKYLPDAKINWRDTITGSVITAILFTTGKNLIGFYIGNSQAANLYEAAGSVIVILVWVYYAAAIFLFGGVLIYVYSNRVNQGVQPKSYAVKIKQKEIEQERPDQPGD